VNDSLYDPSLTLGVLNRSWSSFPDTLFKAGTSALRSFAALSDA